MLPLVAVCFSSCEKDNGNEDELSGDDIIQFEDPNFLKALLTVQEIDIYDPDSPDADSEGDVPYTVDVDENKDGQISVNEAQKVRGLELWDNETDESFNVSTMPEIKYFTALECLYCSDNQLTSLDVSKNTALTELYCVGNQLATLDISKNTALIVLSCSENQLTTLDVSNNTTLTELWCSENQLTTLDVSNNTILITLGCDNNRFTSLDVSKNTSLTYLSCGYNQLTTLDLSNNTALEALYCVGNPFTKIILNRNNKIYYYFIQNIINEYGEDIIEYVE